MTLVILELGCVHSGFVDQNSTKILMSAQLYPGPESYGFSVVMLLLENEMQGFRKLLSYFLHWPGCIMHSSSKPV